MEQESLKTPVVTKRLRSTTKNERSQILYEQVIAKNFQTINDLLKKLHQVLARHDEFEVEMGNYTKRLSKLQTDMEAIHNEHRRDNLHIFTDIQDLKLELRGIDGHIKMIYEETKKKNFMKLMEDSSRNPKQGCDQSSLADGSSGSEKKQANDNDICSRKSSNFSQSQFGLKISKYPSQSSKHPSSEQLADSKVPKKAITTESIGKISEDSSGESSKPIRHRENTLNSKRTSNESKASKALFRKSMDSSIKKGPNFFLLAENNNKSNLLTINDERQESQICSLDERSIEFSQRAWKLKQFKMKQNEDPEGKPQMKLVRNSSLIVKNKRQSKIVPKQMWIIDHKNQEKRVTDEPPGVLTKQQFQQYVKVCLQEERIKDIDNKIDEGLYEYQEIKKQVNVFNKKVEQMIEKYKNVAFAQNLSSEIFKVMKQINKLRQYCLENFANKSETKKAILFMQSKVKNSISYIECDTQDTLHAERSSNLISKCISCNRASQFSTNTSKNHEQSIQKRIYMKELKKKTIQFIKYDLKGERRRYASKFQRSD